MRPPAPVNRIRAAISFVALEHPLSRIGDMQAHGGAGLFRVAFSYGFEDGTVLLADEMETLRRLPVGEVRGELHSDSYVLVQGCEGLDVVLVLRGVADREVEVVIRVDARCAGTELFVNLVEPALDLFQTFVIVSFGGEGGDFALDPGTELEAALNVPECWKSARTPAWRNPVWP